jgi:DNA topoisomerase-1
LSLPAAPSLDAVKTARLHYVTDSDPGIRRKRAGKGFTYVKPRGGAVKDAATLDRIAKLAIPPAWTDVWICADSDGHIQATGRDVRGRKQHRYHAKFRETRDQSKFDHLLEFGVALPKIRAAILRDLRRPDLPRRKVLAAVVRLLDITSIRIGNEDYAAQNKSYGLSTLRDRHAKIAGDEIKLIFMGKSGKEWRVRLKDKRVAKVMKAAQDLPGQKLFQFEDENGKPQPITSTDINAYLREISGMDVTAKDFRTWTGSTLAAQALAERETPTSDAMGKRLVKDAIGEVAARLGNTVSVCRKCYVHPAIVDAYLEGDLKLRRRKAAGLSADEAALQSFLRAAAKPSRTRKTPARAA